MDYSKKDIEKSFLRNFSVEYENYTFPPLYDCITPNWHEKFEFIFVNSGNLQITINNKEINVFPNALAVIAPNLLHSAKTGDNGCNYTTISFNHKIVLDNTIHEQALYISLLNGTLKIDNLIVDNMVAKHFYKLYEICINKNTSQPIIEKGYACLFFAYLIDNFAKKTEKIHITNTRFEGILEYMTKNFAKPITTKQIAERFSYNKSYFCRKFQEITKLTPTEFILNLRIEHSQNLMTTTHLSLNDISLQSGFTSYPYFSLKFKEKIGITPTEWRENFLNNS